MKVLTVSPLPLYLQDSTDVRRNSSPPTIHSIGHSWICCKRFLSTTPGTESPPRQHYNTHGWMRPWLMTVRRPIGSARASNVKPSGDVSVEVIDSFIIYRGNVSTGRNGVGGKLWSRCSYSLPKSDMVFGCEQACRILICFIYARKGGSYAMDSGFIFGWLYHFDLWRPIVHLYITFVFFTMVFCITPGCCLVYQSTNACSLNRLEFYIACENWTQLLVVLRQSPQASATSSTSYVLNQIQVPYGILR